MSDELKFNLEHLNRTAEFSSKALLTLNSGAFITSLGFAIKSPETFGPFLFSFALGLTLSICMIVSNYFLFLFSTDEKNNGWPKLVFCLNKISIVLGLFAAFQFVCGIWKITLSF